MNNNRHHHHSAYSAGPGFFCAAATQDPPSQTPLNCSPSLKYSIAKKVWLNWQFKFHFGQDCIDKLPHLPTVKQLLDTLWNFVKIFTKDLPGSRCPHWGKVGGMGPFTERSFLLPKQLCDSLNQVYHWQIRWIWSLLYNQDHDQYQYQNTKTLTIGLWHNRK